MGNKPSEILGKFANRYPVRVIKEAARLYAILGSVRLVAEEVGVSSEVVRYWQSRYAWAKPPMPLSELPRQWVCECGRRCRRDAKERPLCACGRVPAWGKVA